MLFFWLVAKKKKEFLIFEEGGVDMCKKLIILCLVLTFTLVSTSYGECPSPYRQLVIGDWELASDGWISWGSATLNYSTIGVTLNEFSLQVTHNNGWNIDPVYPMQSQGPNPPPLGNTEEFFLRQYFCVDVTRIASEWVEDPCDPGDAWSNLGLVINCGDNEGGVPPAGWLSIGDAGNGWWSPADGNKTVELCWDYSAIRDALYPYRDRLDWLELIIYSNTGGYLSPVNYYLDKAMLCGLPEPATIALLGLGGLALLRRKRA
jgi:hypothetical protein